MLSSKNAIINRRAFVLLRRVLFQMKPFLVLNGPNLNLLGQREPNVYGSQTLADLQALLEAHLEKHPAYVKHNSAFRLSFLQSNHEGELLDALHNGIEHSQGLLINAGAFTHTSIALRDALSAYPHPKIEIHISNIYKREAFRHHSHLSPVVDGVICGLGLHGYVLGLEALLLPF
jgi:3-dehydroquinate dehydratase II